jgi:hypothetical protein
MYFYSMHNIFCDHYGPLPMWLLSPIENISQVYFSIEQARFNTMDLLTLTRTDYIIQLIIFYVITFLNDFNEFGKRDKSIECVIIDQVFQNSQKRT